MVLPRDNSTSIAVRVSFFRRQLDQLLDGREDHPDAVSLCAIRDEERTRVHWEDELTHEGGLLGILERWEKTVVVRDLFCRIYDWRRRCKYEGRRARSATAAVAGGAQ